MSAPNRSRRDASPAMSGLRVSGGELRGRRLTSPRRGVRPTSERVREALFSIIGDLSGARVLDLFCGTGALGIEAISRGAASATLVDRDVGAARRNVESLAIGDRAKVVRSDALRFLRDAEPGSFELVLCDPPYRLADRLAVELDQPIRQSLAEGGRVIVETTPDTPLELSLPLITERRYGDTLVRVYGGST
jgi:16S rRNA (guanine966-N2)-methyltransferase